ncbi:unnamed protein product [Lactuca virosa]|uniref:Uncharacterized protein n=1 Tax=Lactuca virosa TaxID=75947 RepID=A0AAU9PTE6_9ASTR|nr:unnamed protein product [Lactuca virosa]
MDDCVNVSYEKIMDKHTDDFEGFRMKPNEHDDEFYLTFLRFVVSFVKDIKCMLEEEKMTMELMKNTTISFHELVTKDEKEDGMLHMLTVEMKDDSHHKTQADDDWQQKFEKDDGRSEILEIALLVEVVKV